MEYAFIDSANGTIGDKRKGVKSDKVCTVSRKKLADISNLQQPKPSIQADKPLPISSKDYIEQLQKYNASLMNLLADRNKIIQLSGTELQKLQFNMKKMQQQNSQLAQANNHILVELNSGRDRLKAFSHELGCKNSLIKSLKIVPQAKAGALPCQETGDKGVETAESYQAEKDDGKPCNINMPQSGNQTLRHSGKQNTKDTTENKSKRRQSARFYKPNDPQPSEDLHEINTNSRRRRSARIKSDVDPKPSEDLFKIEDAIFPLLNDSMHEDHLLIVKEEEEVDGATGSGSQQSRRSSLGRPQRRAAEKIQSYKENPINIKMRR